MTIITDALKQKVLGTSYVQDLAKLQPTLQDDRWKSIPWMTNIMAARRRSAKEKLPILLWIMVGNPQGCT